MDDKNGRRQAAIIVDPDIKIVKLVQRVFELRANQKLSYREIAKLRLFSVDGGMLSVKV